MRYQFMLTKSKKKISDHKKLSLNILSPRQRAVVSELQATGSMRRRLMDIGLTPGTEIYCLGSSPFGDPSAYLIRGTVIALRRKDCQKIIIHTSELSSENSVMENSLNHSVAEESSI